MPRGSDGRVLLLIPILLLVPRLALAEAPAALAIEFSLEPSGETAGAFEAAAVIRDAETDEVLAAPRLLFLEGDEAVSRTTLPDGRHVELAVLVSESGGEATYRATLIDEDVERVLQEATVKLGS